MGRDEGFAIADVASDYLDDSKVRNLWRRLAPDVGAMCEALVIREAVLLGSWREGRRVTVDDASPLWLPIREDLVEALVAVGLLDRTRRVPQRSWTSWFDPAVGRREARREAGRRGGVASGKRRRSDASSDAEPPPNPSGPSGPDRPIRPNRPSSPARAPARGGAARGGSPVGFREAMASAGYPPPEEAGS